MTWFDLLVKGLKKYCLMSSASWAVTLGNNAKHPSGFSVIAFVTTVALDTLRHCVVYPPFAVDSLQLQRQVFIGWWFSVASHAFVEETFAVSLFVVQVSAERQLTQMVQRLHQAQYALPTASVVGWGLAVPDAVCKSLAGFVQTIERHTK